MTYFSKAELSCQHCGGYVFDQQFLDTLNDIRAVCGFPLPVSSGYRCPAHPIEAKKDRPGTHSTGKAVDIQISGWRAYRLLEVALAHGVKRVGVNQSGPHSQRFIHLDAASDDYWPAPALWSY